MFSAMLPNGISYARHLDHGIKKIKDTDKNRWTVGSRRRATQLGRCNIIELAGGLWSTWYLMISVCIAVAL